MARAPWQHGVDRLGPQSLLSTKTRDALLEAIRSGRFPNGKLPAEVDLAAALGVSRTTLRAALVTLEQDGVVSRRRGIGTRVVPCDETQVQLELNRLTALSDLLRDRGHVPSTSIVGVERAVLPDLAKRVGQPPDSEWHVIEKVFYGDGRPAALLRDHILCAVLPELPADPDAYGTIFGLFAEFGPEPISLARVELEPRIASDEVVSRLEIEPGAPLLRLWQRHFGADHKPLAISRIDVNDSFIRFEIVRRL